MNNTKKIGLFVLIMFIIGAIDSLRNMPAAAMFGPSLIFFFIAAAITFLAPIALLSAELSSYHPPEKNGVYYWIKEAFGNKTAFMGIWLQWINTAIWFPTILSFIAGGFAYLINPALVHSKVYVVTVILVSFWSMAFLSLKNFKLSAGFASLCTLFGFVLPFCVMIGLLAVWLFGNHTLQIHVNFHTIMPDFSSINNWISLTAIITAFLGMELAAVNVKDMKNPQKNYPIGVLVSSGIILLTMVFGCLAIAFVIPPNHISLISGIFQTLAYYLGFFHLKWMVFVISALIVFSSIGEMISWIISPARGLQQAALTGTLPKFFTKNNKNGMPSNVLILQAVIVTVVCLAFTLFKSVNDIYWLLTDLSTELYVLMYILMFLAALKLHYKHKTIVKPFQIPGGAYAKWILCLFGLISALVALVIGFIPPSQLSFGGIWHYSFIFAAGMILLCLPAGWFLFQKTPKLSYTANQKSVEKL